MAINKKNKFEKNLNWFHKTTGINENIVYFWFLTILGAIIIGVDSPVNFIFLSTFSSWKLSFFFT